MTSPSIPEPGATLSAESVKLLLPGDVLAIDTGGAHHVFVARKSPPSKLICTARGGKERYYMPHRFCFVSRAEPDPAATEEAETCPICGRWLVAGDVCATDIEMGACHAECLEGSPVVNLDTGEPTAGPAATFVFEATPAANKGRQAVGGGEARRLALEDAGALERTAEEADDNQWQDWAATMRQAASRIRTLAALAQPTPSTPPEPDAGREAIWRVVHEVWQLLDDAETDSKGVTTPDQERWNAVSEAMDALEAMVPESEGPFWGGFPVNYLWAKGEAQ